MSEKMPEKTKLEELSSELPERERKELLAKIARNRRREEREEIVRVELKSEERERLITEEMLQIGRWGQFILWLKHILSGKTRRELFLNMKLAQLKHRVKQRTPGLSGFETRNLTPKFAQSYFDLYAAAYPLRDLFHLFSQDAGFRDQAVVKLLNEKYADAKKDVEELVSIDQMEAIYADRGDEEDIKKQVLRNFTEYLKKIPEKQFLELEEGLKPLIYLGRLVLFSFDDIFRHFNYNPGDHLDDKYPYFDHAPVMLMMDQLERLFYAIYVSLKLSRDWFCHEEILYFYSLWRRGVDEADALDQQEIEHEVGELSPALSNLVDTASGFNHSVPLLVLIKYFRKDPYYSLIFNIPHLNIKNIYVSAMKKLFLEQLDEKMAEVKKNVLDRKILDIFKTNQLLELFYYNDKPSFDFRKLGLPYFVYTKSLVLFYNYLSRVYKGYIQEVIRLANAYLLFNNRLVQGKLMQCAAGLEELEAKIVLFDRSLSPDEDDGKALVRYRHKISTDITQQKKYKNFILEKDEEARELLDQGEEDLLGIKRIFDELLGSPMENIRSTLKTIHFQRGKNQTLSHLLKGVSEIVGDFSNLLDQLRLLEKGS